MSAEPTYAYGAPQPAAAEKTIIVSHRLPVTLAMSDGQARLTRSAGGLATALRTVHEDPHALWIGWPGDLSELDRDARAEVETKLDESRAVPVHVTKDEASLYYEGFANGVLWPLCHYLIERLRLDADRNWEAYRTVNERFAEAVAARYRSGDAIWVHDYQLALVPGMLRALLPDARIGYFHHIPFPSAEVFRILPWREELLAGLLGADVVGFQTAADAYHFTYSCAQILGVEPTLDVLHHEGRTIRVAAYPISVDAGNLAAIARSDEVIAEVARIREAAKDRIVVLGVDRLDYTKGIHRRISAIERLLDTDESAREKLHFIQIAVPTRQDDASYVEVRRAVNELVSRVNGKHGTATHVPIHLLHRTVDPTELSALYCAADVMVVTPIRDGMNLVAKEYVASRVDDDGVLVLSEFAGAAVQLREAIIVNPYDQDAVAHAIGRAMTMGATEQHLRMKALRECVTRHDVSKWAEGFLSDLRAEPAAVTPAASFPAGVEAFRVALADIRSATRLTLILDYDGTLVPFAATPDLAIPDPALVTLLSDLAARSGTTVHLCTGRSRSSLERWFGELPIGLYAEHGYWARPTPGSPWMATSQASLAWKELVRPILQEIAARTPGTHFEEKTSGLVLHYRATEPQLAFGRLRELRQRLSQLAEYEQFDVLRGNKLIEVRARGTNKGMAANAIVSAHADGAIFAAGDDRTDEEMFAALAGKAMTVRVGAGRSHAKYAVHDYVELRRALESLIEPKERGT